MGNVRFIEIKRLRGVGVVATTLEGATIACKGKAVLWIAGYSGSGKSWISKQLAGRLGISPIVHLDQYGTRKGSKWLVDINQLPDAKIYEGTADNVFEWAARLRPYLVLICPSYELWKAVSCAKAADYAKMEKINKDWLDAWVEQSKYSFSEYQRFQLRRLQFIIDAVAKDDPGRVLLVLNHGDPSLVTRGWD